MPKIYEVGGCVRDRLLGTESHDIDFTFVLDDLSGTTSDGFDRMTQYLKENDFKVFQSIPNMFTIKAKFPKSHKHAGVTADFVMARKEVGYVPDTRNPILELGTLADDLIRRDFTLNAMAQDDDGNIIDLFDGERHLRERILVTPRDPRETFMDDPLRMIRALRFSVTKGFTIREDVWDAMFQDGLIDKLKTVVSIERIRDELLKMFQHDSVAALRILARVDAVDRDFVDAAFGRGMWLMPTFKSK